MPTDVYDCEPDERGVYHPVRKSTSIAGGIGKVLDDVKELVDAGQQIKGVADGIRETIRSWKKPAKNPRRRRRRLPAENPVDDDVVDAEEL